MCIQTNYSTKVTGKEKGTERNKDSFEHTLDYSLATQLAQTAQKEAETRLATANQLVIDRDRQLDDFHQQIRDLRNERDKYKADYQQTKIRLDEKTTELDQKDRQIKHYEYSRSNLHGFKTTDEMKQKIDDLKIQLK